MMLVDTEDLPAVYPVGRCYCGCGNATNSPSKYFVNTHDHPALTKVIGEVYGNTSTFLVAHGYGPDVNSPAPLGGDGLGLRVDDRVEGDTHTGRFTGTVVAVHKSVVIVRDDATGKRRSGVFRNFVHEIEEAPTGGCGRPLRKGERGTADCRGGPYPNSTITSIRGNGEVMFTDGNGREGRHCRPERFFRD